MAKMDLSHELLAACLILVDGDINSTIEEMLCRADEFQETHNRHFGISDTDLRGLFLFWTTFDLEIRKSSDPEAIDDIKLRDVINLMLKCHDAYFNDEGEYMLKEEESDNSPFNDIGKCRSKRVETDNSPFQYCFDTEEAQYRKKMLIKNKMREFFRDVESKDISGKDVMGFFSGMGFTREILIECTRPGSSS
jgi:hypothetical protein